MVSAVDLPPLSAGPASPPIWLNAWSAEQLQAKPGAPVTISYDVWDDAGGLVRREASFVVAGVLPMTAATGGADATLTPEYPGITGQESLSDWDPPFPLDLSRITQRDEDYWDKFRAAPKAIVRLADGQRLWQSRYGGMTSIRLATQTPTSATAYASASTASTASAPTASASAASASASVSAMASAPAPPAADAAMQSFRQALQSALTPDAAGFIVQPVRATALAASSGVTDFGEYFLYFSFFIVVSGLLLAGLFFRLGVEQRLREVGLLSAIGYSPALVRRLFLIEGLYLAIAGSAIGVAGAIGYAALIMLGLRTWWVGAVGTTALTLQPSATSLLIGAAGGIVTAVLAIAWTLRGVTRVPARTLLHGDVQDIQAQASDAAPAAPAAAPTPRSQWSDAFRRTSRGASSHRVHRLRRPRARTDRRIRGRRDERDRRFLRRGRHRAARRAARPLALAPPRARAAHAIADVTRAVALRADQRGGAARTHGVVRRADRVRHLRHRHRRGLPSGGSRGSRRSEVGDRRIRVDGRIDRANHRRSELLRRPRIARPRFTDLQPVLSDVASIARFRCGRETMGAASICIARKIPG